MNNDEEIIKVDPDLIGIVPLFFESAREDIKKIRRALADSDFDTVRITGHSFKGSGGSYGFKLVSRIGAGIEIAAKESNSDEAERLVGELANYLDNVKFEPGEE